MKKRTKKAYKAEYQALRNAIDRCTRKSHAQYDDYGGRGITVDASFIGPDGFWNFLKAVGPKPSPELTLDRVSNDKGYEPGNLAWTSRTVQQRNRRRFRAKVKDLGWGLKAYPIVRKDGKAMTLYSPIVELDGERKSLVEWSVTLGVKTRTLQQRLQRGMSPNKALTSVLFSPWGKPRNDSPTIH